MSTVTQLTTDDHRGLPAPAESDVSESVESFRARAAEWIAANLPKVTEKAHSNADQDEAAWEHAKALQRLLYSGGFAGICFPVAYGGRGLSPAHQKAFSEAAVGYEMPTILNTPTFTIVGATLLDMASEHIKTTYLSAAIRGEITFVQFLSEGRGGSDLAGVTTRSTRDGDVYLVNGEKIWSSGAYAADYALCLTRSNWDAPKHSGLTMLFMKIHQPGVQIRRIKQINGNEEFCEEFFDDAEVPAENVVGEENNGWAVASRQLFHERNAVGGGSPYASGDTGAGERSGFSEEDLVELIRGAGIGDDIGVRELVAESHISNVVQEQLIERVVAGMTAGQIPGTGGSIIRLFGGVAASQRAEIDVKILGSLVAVGDPATTEVGMRFLARQGGSLGGGSTEMARNIISERILSMPREFAADKELPFNQVKIART